MPTQETRTPNIRRQTDSTGMPAFHIHKSWGEGKNYRCPSFVCLTCQTLVCSAEERDDRHRCGDGIKKVFGPDIAGKVSCYGKCYTDWLSENPRPDCPTATADFDDCDCPGYPHEFTIRGWYTRQDRAIRQPAEVWQGPIGLAYHRQLRCQTCGYITDRLA